MPLKMQRHLRETHTEHEIQTIPTSFYSDAEVHKCPFCSCSDLALFKTSKSLTRHLESKHEASIRTVINSDILLARFPPHILQCTEAATAWKATLRYLHNLDIIPFAFRKSLYHLIDFKTKKEIQKIAHLVYVSTTIAAMPHVNANLRSIPAHETTSTSLWKMTLLLEGTLLAPPAKHEPRNYKKLVNHRIQLFRSGQFSQLHRQAMQYKAIPSYSKPTETQRTQQIHDAANNDDWRKASKLLSEPLPAMPYTPDNLPKVQRLHPPRSSYTPTRQIPRPTTTFHRETFNSANSLYTKRLTDEFLIQKSLCKLTRGTASGPLADSIDFLRDVFLSRAKTPDDDEKYLHLSTLASIYHLIFTGNVPKDVKRYLSYNESVSFYKKPPSLEDIRPIGIGIAWRRLASAHAVNVTRDSAATYLAPTQFAIGLSSGMDFITHTVETQVQRFITKSPSSTSPPSRVLLVLDLVNMFNNVSMTRAREIIHAQFPHLLPLFDILYYDDSRCYYRDELGNRHFFLRREGASQGCPFAALLACLILHDVITPINLELQQRAKIRKDTRMPSDDSLGSLAIPLCYIDDTTVSICYDDLQFFLNKFHELGPPLGCFLKPQKCKILTSTNGTSPRHLLSQPHLEALTYCLQKFCGGIDHGEVVDGIRILGHPIGAQSFVSTFQHKTVSKLSTATQSLQHLVKDPQISLALFKFSLQHYTKHLLFTDMLHNTNISPSYKQYHTNFIETINSITKHYLSTLAGDPDATSFDLPDHSWTIATTPTGLGGMGIIDLSMIALQTYIVPLAKSIRASQHGFIPTPIISPNIENISHSISLPKPIAFSFRSWKHSTLPVFQTYSKLTKQYITGVEFQSNRATGDRFLDFTLHSSLHATSTRFQKDIVLKRSQLLWHGLPPPLKKTFPSTMSTLTSVPLNNITRTDPTNHFSAQEFLVYLQRKLRLPIWPKLPSKCICNSHMDPYGDHLFTCPKASKTDLHNRIRDSLYLICQNITPLVSSASSKDTHLELPHIFTSAPNKRPGDVVLCHPIHNTDHIHSKTLIDVTVIPPCKSPLNASSFPEIIQHMSKHHQAFEMKKFKIKNHENATGDQLAQEAVVHRYRFLPFTIDHQGMIGPIASEFLLNTATTMFKTTSLDYATRNLSIPTSRLIKLAFHKDRQKNILKIANANWRKSYGTKWFTNNYQAQTPGQWAKQMLGTTFSLHSAKHIIRALNTIQSTSHTPTKTPKLQCCSINLHTPTLYAQRTLQYNMNTV